MARRKGSGSHSSHIRIGGDAVGSTIIAGDTVHIHPVKKTGGHSAGEPGDDAGEQASSAPGPGQMALYRVLRDAFDLEELETISWEIGIRFEDLPAKTPKGKARQLVDRASALNALGQLKAIVQRERPGAQLGD